MRHNPILCILAIAIALPAFGQRALTADDYARAEKFLGYNTNPLVLHSPSRPVWLADDRFWYRVTTERGTEFILADPPRATRAGAFDQIRLAGALSTASGTTYEPFRLPFTQFTFEDGNRAIAFNIGNRRWTCDVQGSKCNSTNRNEIPNSVLS